MVMGARELIGSTLYNTMLFISPDGTFNTRELDAHLHGEAALGMGDGSTSSRWSMLISAFWEDLSAGNTGSLLARAAMHAKREVVHIAQWPWVRDLHQVASRHYAFEGSALCLLRVRCLQWMTCLKATAPFQGRLLAEWRCSRPWGRPGNFSRGREHRDRTRFDLIVEPLFDACGTIHATVGLDLVTEGHLLMDSDGHYSRPDVFSLTVNTSPMQGVRFVP